MKRVFVAIDISDEARQRVAARISDFQAASRDSTIKWIRPEKLHLTIRFLGDVDEAQLSTVANAVSKVCKHFKAFNLSLRGVGAFPSDSKARVLWIGVDDDHGLCVKFKETLEAELRQLGFAGHRKPLKPHLTVARTKDKWRAANTVRAHLNTEFGPVRFDVSEIVIYESKLHRNGSVYSKLACFQLSGDV